MPQEVWCPACRQNVAPRWSPDERRECPRCANPLEPSFIPPASPATPDLAPDPFASPDTAADVDALLAQARPQWRTLSGASAARSATADRPPPTRIRIDQAERGASATRPTPPSVPPRRPLTASGFENPDNFPPTFLQITSDPSGGPGGMLPAVAAFLGVFILGAGATLVVYGQFNPGTRMAFLGQLLTLAGQLVLLLGVVGLIAGTLRRTGQDLSAHTAALLAKWQEFHQEWSDQLRRTDGRTPSVSTPAQLRERLNQLAQDIDRLAG